jgi:hypothetical protein
MQKCLFQIILITLITSTPLFAELTGYAIPKNYRTYLGQTSDFFCPIPSDSSFKMILGINGGLNGFYHNGLLGNIPAAAECNLFIIFRLIGRSQIQIDGGYYGFDDWQNKANIGINYIYDFSIPLAGITYIAISPGFHFLGINKTESIILEDGQGKSIYEPDLHTNVSYRTNLNSILSYQLKVRVSKLFGIIEPYLSLSIYYHQDHFSQNGSYYYQNNWNYTGIQNINYKSTDLAIHTGFSLIGRGIPFFLNFAIGINPGYTTPFNNIPSPISLSVGYRFKTQ